MAVNVVRVDRRSEYCQFKDILHIMGSKLLQSVGKFSRKNAVMLIALFLAIVTCFFIPPDAQYLEYFVLNTLSCLLAVLAIVCALKNVNFFYFLAERTVKFFKTARSSVLALVYITFIGSMLIANDMVLLTFLPLGYLVLTNTKKEKYMIFTFVMQNVAANLGGMLTPFGNPQNLYLYSKFNIPTLEFWGIMVIPFALSVLMITVCCLIFVKKEPLVFEGETARPEPKRTSLYLVLFVLSIVMVFRVAPYWIGLPIILVVLLIVDRNALARVDYPLLLTFVCFFIFAGNMARIDAVRAFFYNLLSINTLLFSALACQVISNVPSAILLSQFTENYAPLLIGVNIGGVGTLISSLASLITFREYCSHNPGKSGRYLGIFSAFNFSFLVILAGVMLLLELAI